MGKQAKRINTRLEAEGAEFLVLGNLLLQKITAFKAYVNHAGYDIVAVNEKKNTSARIQVKSRYQTGWNGFIIKNFDCDFVVLAILNRGYKKLRKDGDEGIREPEFYVFERGFIEKLSPKNDWGKIQKSKLKDHLEVSRNRWDLIQEFLDDTHKVKK
jgi:hypothetical protein